MLDTITLRAGPTPTAPSQAIPLTPVTVFVGPNNSGKSRLLTELAQFCASGRDNAGALLLAHTTLVGCSPPEIEVILDSMRAPVMPAVVLTQGNVILRSSQNTFQVSEALFKAALSNPNESQESSNYACSWFLMFHTVMLDAVRRMTLINEGPAGDLLAHGNTPTQVLFRKDALRQKLREKLFDAFGLYFSIDPTNIPNLRIKLSDIAPPSPAIERGWAQESVDFHTQSREIQQFSDGVRAFTGILTAVTAGEPSVILVDEPEAFLHPALAFKLGKDIAETTADSKKRLLAATHSPDFVMGCIQSGACRN
jgi:hypothetical protein